jgi:hypothetical protein
MASRFPARRNSFQPKAVKLARPVRTPPTADVVDAVLRFHDLALDQGGGRLMLRLSPDRVMDAEVKAALGPQAANAAGVSILWNEREGEIIRVLAA